MEKVEKIAIDITGDEFSIVLQKNTGEQISISGERIKEGDDESIKMVRSKNWDMSAVDQKVKTAYSGLTGKCLTIMDALQ